MQSGTRTLFCASTSSRNANGHLAKREPGPTLHTPTFYTCKNSSMWTNWCGKYSAMWILWPFTRRKIHRNCAEKRPNEGKHVLAQISRFESAPLCRFFQAEARRRGKCREALSLTPVWDTEKCLGRIVFDRFCLGRLYRYDMMIWYDDMIWWYDMIWLMLFWSILYRYCITAAAS